MSQLGQKIHRPKHLHAGEFAAGQSRVSIEKSLDAMLIRSAENVQHNFSMPARADDYNIHVNVIGRFEGKLGDLRFSICELRLKRRDGSFQSQFATRLSSSKSNTKSKIP